MYTVQFISSGIVAARFQDRAAALHWLSCNNYGDDKSVLDPDTGEVVDYAQGDCLNLFKLIKVKQ